MSVVNRPAAFFGVCSSAHKLDEFLLNFAGVSEMAAIISARDAATSHGAVDIDVVIDYMDKVAVNKKAVRAFYRKFGSYAAWLWLAAHTDLYDSAQGSVGEAVKIALLGLNPPASTAVSMLIQAGSNARLEGIKLREDMELTPVPYVNGWEVAPARAMRCFALRSATMPCHAAMWPSLYPKALTSGCSRLAA